MSKEAHCKYPKCSYPCPDLPDCRDAEQPAQQEPVTWGVDWGKAGDIPCVSIIKRLPGGGIEVVAVEYGPYSYTSPPAQRTWVGLTNDEVNNLAAGCHLGNSVQDAIYKAAAKLKEKNT